MSSYKNKIGIGTVQFGLNYGISNNLGKTNEQEVDLILNYSKEKNIKYLDTAYAYGDAEVVLGKKDIRTFRVVSKYISNHEYNLNQQIEISLKRLNKDSIYGYLAHRPLDLIEKGFESWEKMIELKELKKVKKIGASFNTIKEINQVLESGINLDIVQVPYNIFDSRFEKYMKELHEKGCEIHTRSTFLQGLFFCKVDELHPYFEEVKPLVKYIQSLDKPAVQLLKYVVKQPFVDVVNIGVNSLSQLKDNIEFLEKIEYKIEDIDYHIKNEILIPSNWPK